MNNKGFKLYHSMIAIVVIGILLTIVLFIMSGCIEYKDAEQSKIEYKTQQYDKSLPGMNYNNTESWYKDCKVKVIYYNSFKNGWEKYVNEFINGKDVVDIKVCKDRILIVYTDSLKFNREEQIYD